MTTGESKGRFFYKTNWFESIRITNRIESIRIANWNTLVANDRGRRVALPNSGEFTEEGWVVDLVCRRNLGLTIKKVILIIETMGRFRADLRGPKKPLFHRT